MDIGNPRTPIECIGLACVNIDPAAIAPTPIATYLFANGFETSTPEGALPLSPPIEVFAPGVYTLFLNEPVDTGKAIGQGGVVALVEVSGRDATAPAIAFATVEYEPVLAAPYLGVGIKRAIRVSLLNTAIPIVGPAQFTIAIYRNNQTIFKHQPPARL